MINVLYRIVYSVVVIVVAFFILLGIWNLRTTLTGLLAAAGMVGIVIGLSLRGKLLQAIVEEFRKEKIAIPFPQVTISSRESETPKNG